MSTARFFTPITFISCLSITISAVVAGLATVNFGILSIWVNGSVGVLTLLYHLTALILTWRRNRATSTPSHDAKVKKLMLPDVKMPAIPSPAYSPPSYDSEKLVPNRRFSSQTVTVLRPSQNYLAQLEKIPTGAFYSIVSLVVIIILTILTVIGLGMTVELTNNGATFLLPAERAKGMTFPWNLNVQKAQCSFLGVLLFLDLVMLVVCVNGRNTITRLENERREEIEYGFASPDVSYIYCDQIIVNQLNVCPVF